ncbi:MAG TPA: hypothetical protein EYG11_20400 [Candidatus Latescibacteria bacterium]|nr:hypothetical protein [Candidatus Handelsmanbacteria bacterium]HIL11064.1 hypothetical protein [Candidatus Latescibacterota bacterium]
MLGLSPVGADRYACVEAREKDMHKNGKILHSGDQAATAIEVEGRVKRVFFCCSALLWYVSY